MAKKRNGTAIPPVAEPTTAELMAEVLKNREEGRSHYERADVLFDLLRKKLKVGKVIKHPTTGEEFHIVDNFDGKNKVFRAHGISRYELAAIKGSRKA